MSGHHVKQNPVVFQHDTAEKRAAANSGAVEQAARQPDGPRRALEQLHGESGWLKRWMLPARF